MALEPVLAASGLVSLEATAAILITHETSTSFVIPTPFWGQNTLICSSSVALGRFWTTCPPSRRQSYPHKVVSPDGQMEGQNQTTCS